MKRISALITSTKKDKRIIFINNGIHPGEPDGIDASMLLVRDIVTKKIKLPDNVILAIIPVYNIGGCLNRSPNYRIDQNGPVEKGFRGNSQNLDLNRDFIKCDSKEARSFSEIFHLLDPDIFIDNHVSDGADYQHVMTLIATQHNKLGGPMGDYLNKKLEPSLYTLMKDKGYDLVPYVNAFGDTPENGWTEFWDSPRYSSGYAALWNCFAFIPESHMLKPFEQRVKATYSLLLCFIEFTAANGTTIKNIRDEQKKFIFSSNEFPISWKLDSSKFTEINYKGYEATHKPSEVSALPRLYYDHNKPFERKVKFYNYYKVESTIKKPLAYIIPQGWWRITDLLKLNKIQMSQLSKDTIIKVEMYHIDNYKSSSRSYEMHHINSDVKITSSIQAVRFHKGDYYIPVNKQENQFLIQTLEPQGEDSYFAWNFFDAILGQKEGYSDYSFEDIAANYLKNNPHLKEKLDQQKEKDSVFAHNARAQLNFIFKNSPFFEPAYLQYPIYRVTR